MIYEAKHSRHLTSPELEILGSARFLSELPREVPHAGNPALLNLSDVFITTIFGEFFGVYPLPFSLKNFFTSPLTLLRSICTGLMVMIYGEAFQGTVKESSKNSNFLFGGVLQKLPSYINSLS